MYYAFGQKKKHVKCILKRKELISRFLIVFPIINVTRRAGLLLFRMSFNDYSFRYVLISISFDFCPFSYNINNIFFQIPFKKKFIDKNPKSCAHWIFLGCNQSTAKD